MKNRKQHLLNDHDEDSMNLAEDMASIAMTTATNGEEVNDVAVEDDDDDYIDDNDNDSNSTKIDKKDDAINEATSMDIDYDNVNNSEMATDTAAGQKRKANAISEDEHQTVENEVQDDELADRAKAARVHCHHFLTRAPMVPHYIAHRILQGLGTQVSQRNQFVKQMCKYWALKREMRRGAPLLKRLHLEVG
jgi:hypothetical protein